MMRRILHTAAALLAAAMLSGCMVDISGISFGSARKTVRARGEDHKEIDLLLFAEQAGDHTLAIEDIYFTDGGIELTIDPALEDNPLRPRKPAGQHRGQNRPRSRHHPRYRRR